MHPTASSLAAWNLRCFYSFLYFCLYLVWGVEPPLNKGVPPHDGVFWKEVKRLTQGNAACNGIKLLLSLNVILFYFSVPNHVLLQSCRDILPRKAHDNRAGEYGLQVVAVSIPVLE